MATMAAIGSLKVPSSSSSSSNHTRRLSSSSQRKTLSFSSSSLTGEKLNPTQEIIISNLPRRTERRTPSIVSPKAVSDSQNSQTCLDPDASRSVLGIILGGGAGTRLYPLTKKRAKPAVPLGANYRLIDIPVSNCLNSNISKIYVLTQFNSASLNRHLSRAYASNMGGYKNEGFVEVLAAQQSPENPNWFQGTADAVRQYLWLFEEHNVLEFLVLAGDHLYRMDYENDRRRRVESEAPTMATMAMAAIGSSKFPSSSSTSSSNHSRRASSSLRKTLSFSSSSLTGEKLNPTQEIISSLPRSNERRTPSIISPKAVSDSQNSQTCLDPDASRSVLGIILGGGAGTRLYPLTKKRAKPAVPLGANYRLIDIPVSNCLNSNISKIYVLTQFNSASLNRHLSRAYASNMGGYKNEGFVEVLAAQQSPENPNWFQGTADAVRQYLWLFEEHNVLEFLVLAGDHLYRMDYEKFIQAHRETDADITVAALPMDEKRATAFGLMKIDDEGRIIEFAEKPKGEQLKAMKVDTTILGLDDERAKEMPFIASMGIYVVSKNVMLDLLRDQFPGANDFGSEVIPGATDLGLRIINTDNVQEAARETDGYFIKSGIVTVIKDALIPSGTVI
ncbi:hypothetical protein F2Q68_00034555 [Brassica cretica]|uniref:glucose-1-phosphate adenylyltransferase n=2 Tax=Brassica TaxID=3705 RepID=A0A8S9GZR0_BRACR|nr:hypothetical protein F2Q68_00034555 [Brassica cretica]